MKYDSRFMSMRINGILTTIIILLTGLASLADVSLPSIFSDNMVLQRGKPIPLWGTAEPGEQITISFEKEIVYVVADEDGEWKAELKKMKAGGPYELKIEGDNTITFSNVMIGVVWVCSGQSNMEMSFEWVKGGVEEERVKANHTNIRLYTVGKVSAEKRQDDFVGEKPEWQMCNPMTVFEFSSVAYFFGNKLHEELGVPVGLIHSSWGGSKVEAWTSREALQSEPFSESIMKEWNRDVINFARRQIDYERKLLEWENLIAQGNSSARKPNAPYGPGHRDAPGGLFNAMINPLIPYGIDGVIWYQGEGNVNSPKQYQKLFPLLINNWREEWQLGDLPFYYVQIAPFDYLKSQWYNGDETGAAILRESQRMALSLPNTGMVVTTDIGDVNDIHPINKKEVGRRLALWALSKHYKKRKLVVSGPLYKSMEVEGNRIKLSFDYVGKGLVAKNGILTDFTIAGEDQNYFEAKAKIEGNTVVVFSDEVKNPSNVRFGWTNTAEPNFFNEAGLPASPFSTYNIFQENE